MISLKPRYNAKVSATLWPLPTSRLRNWCVFFLFSPAQPNLRSLYFFLLNSAKTCGLARSATRKLYLGFHLQHLIWHFKQLLRWFGIKRFGQPQSAHQQKPVSWFKLWVDWEGSCSEITAISRWCVQTKLLKNQNHTVFPIYLVLGEFWYLTNLGFP